ncbi:acyl CoA binding protein-domain-containing protein [Mycena albidolilacea]|uniref:Acyl CoA binding protein-domain-containing protein n=1 Tax=Mycena albidolilacea TaxID=1033008 RepID=A0AAD7F249_9AGAR|nr:acyl CoA binding protein-domain-containing protein [Mycena albidolilacea]
MSEFDEFLDVPKTEAHFKKAAEIISTLPKDGPEQSTDVKLYFYARFKQATIGDISTSRPGMFDFEGKAKWDAWKQVTDENKSKDVLYQEYVNKLVELLKKDGDVTRLNELKAAA